VQSGRVFFDGKTTVDPVRATRALAACQRVFLCLTPANWEKSLKQLQALLSRAPSWRDKVSIIWLLQDGEVAPVASELRELAKRDFKVTFDSPGDQQGTAISGGFERLVHFLRGIQIGVALGGGAARGMAHLGVLKALEQSGIAIDMIAGTSAGAMTGTLYASGFDPDHLVRCFVRDLRPSWLFRCLPHGEQWNLLYKYRRGHFDPMLRKYLQQTCVEQLSVPMHTITVDLISGSTVVRESGDAVHGIVESINLPLLSTPINRHGQALVDGGLINNVPADVLTAKGCNFVIAVSVTAKMEHEFAKNRPDTPTENMRSASTIQTILRSYLVQNHSVNAIGVQPADFVIEPDVTQFELSEFTRTDELAAVGEESTMEVVPRIRELLHRMDSELFPPEEK
jgi:predicted acylesterase/phospholipase RssA